MQPAQIGGALAGSGAVGAIISILVFPWFQRRYNNRKLYTVLAAFWWPAIAFIPVGNLVARWTQSRSMSESTANAWIWGAVVLIMTPIRIAVNVYP